VYGHSPGRAKNTPEVETWVAPEGVEDADGELYGRPERQGSEDGNQRPGKDAFSRLFEDLHFWNEERIPDSLIPWKWPGPREWPIEVWDCDIWHSDVVDLCHDAGFGCKERSK